MSAESLPCRVRTWIIHCLDERTRRLPAEQGERCNCNNTERVGQRLNQDAWDQVRQLIKNIP